MNGDPDLDPDRASRPQATLAGAVAPNEPPPGDPPKSGRGPTRKGVLAADLIEDCEALDPGQRRVFLANLAQDVPSAALRAAAKERRKALKDYIAAEEAHAAALEVGAHLLSRAAALTVAQRKFVALALAEGPAS